MKRKKTFQRTFVVFQCRESKFVRHCLQKTKEKFEMHPVFVVSLNEPAEMIRRFLLSNFIEKMLLKCVAWRDIGVGKLSLNNVSVKFQMRTRLSSPPDARRSPSDEKSNALTQPECPLTFRQEKCSPRSKRSWKYFERFDFHGFQRSFSLCKWSTRFDDRRRFFIFI